MRCRSAFNSRPRRRKRSMASVTVSFLSGFPGDVEVEVQCLAGSTLPAEVAKQFGYAVTEIGKTERILPVAIIERFARRTDGELEPLVEGSTRPIALSVAHAGICKVKRITFDMPSRTMRRARRWCRRTLSTLKLFYSAPHGFPPKPHLGRLRRETGPAATWARLIGRQFLT